MLSYRKKYHPAKDVPHPLKAHTLWRPTPVESVLRIRDIFVQIRMRIWILEPLTNRSRRGSRRSKNIRCGSGTVIHLHHFSKIKLFLNVTKQWKSRFSVLFLLDDGRILEPDPSFPWKSRFSVLFLLDDGRILEPDPSFPDSDPNPQYSFESPCTFRLI